MALWQFTDGVLWRTYSAEDCARLDDAYLSGKSTCPLSAGAAVDIDNMRHFDGVKYTGTVHRRSRGSSSGSESRPRTAGAGAALRSWGAGASPFARAPVLDPRISHHDAARAGQYYASAPSALGLPAAASPSPSASSWSPRSQRFPQPPSPAGRAVAADPAAQVALRSILPPNGVSGKPMPQKWQWMQDTGSWQDYLPDQSSKLEAAFLHCLQSAGPSRSTVSVNGRIYDVDFARMQQVGSSGKARRVKRVQSTGPSIGVAAGPGLGSAGLAADPVPAASPLRAKSSTLGFAGAGMFPEAVGHAGLTPRGGPASRQNSHSSANGPETEIVWQWQSSPTGGPEELATWENYDPEISSQLENALRYGAPYFYLKTHHGQYQVDMKTMLQINRRDPRRWRPVRRITTNKENGGMALPRADGLPGAGAAGAHGKEFPGEMISKISGTYSVSAGPQMLSGRYTFDLDTQQVHDNRLGPVGTFSCHCIASSPLRAVVEGTLTGMLPMPVMTIVDSEIMTEIQKAGNEGAFFMLPSQFNGAEYPDYDTIITTLDDYRYDNTGGPRGQLASHPAPAQFIIDNAACKARPEGINATKDVLKKLQENGFDFYLVNGYLSVPELRGGSEAAAYDILRQNLHLLRMLVMTGVPACGLTPDRHGVSKAVHIVNLIYASAVPVQAYLNKGGGNAKAVQSEVATILASAQYYGAMKHAARSEAGGPGKKKVYLMPLGGGVFNNTWESIALAMSMAVELLSEEERQLLEICALTWEGNPTEKSSLGRLLSQHQKLATSGSAVGTAARAPAVRAAAAAATGGHASTWNQRGF